MSTDESRRERLAVAGLVFALVAPLTYALERLLEWAQGENGDPRMLLRTLHTAYYWRVSLALWAGVLVAALVSSSFSADRFARSLRQVALCLIPLIVLAFWRWP